MPDREMAEARLDALGEAWLEVHAAGGDHAAIDDAIARAAADASPGPTRRVAPDVASGVAQDLVRDVAQRGRDACRWCGGDVAKPTAVTVAPRVARIGDGGDGSEGSAQRTGSRPFKDARPDATPASPLSPPRSEKSIKPGSAPEEGARHG